MGYLSGEKLKLNKKLNKEAFTLIEMLTSIALIVMITAIFTANFKSGNTRTDLTMSAQKLVADIHAAQNNTLGLVKYGDAANGVQFPAGGWGVDFDMNNPGRYILFADLSTPYSADLGNSSSADAGSMRYDEGEGDPNQGARVVNFSPAITIYSISNGTQSLSSADLTFLPPDPITNIYSGGATSTVLNIVLQDKRENTFKTVRVNFLGLAEVID